MRLGIDLGGTKIELVALASDGSERLRRRVATPQVEGYEAIIRAIADLVATAEKEFGESGTVGVGTPGSVSPGTGLMRNANTTCLNGRALDRDLANALNRPVRVANDANCFALSEATDGAGASARAVFGVIVGTGTGGGLVVDGKLLVGPNAVAGEWGHTPLPWADASELPGALCYCGRRGCVETWLAGPSIAADFERRTGTKVDALEVVALAQGGDRPAITTLESHADRFARSLAVVIDIVDPDVIVLGGGVSNIMSLYEAVPERLQRYVFGDAQHTRVVRAKHGDSSGVRGAAWLWPTNPQDSVP